MAKTENFVIVDKKDFAKLEKIIGKATTAVQKTALAAQQELSVLQAAFNQLSGVQPAKKTRAKRAPAQASGETPTAEPGDFDDKAAAPAAEAPAEPVEPKQVTRKAPTAAKVVQLPKPAAKAPAAKTPVTKRAVAPAMPGRR